MLYNITQRFFRRGRGREGWAFIDSNVIIDVLGALIVLVILLTRRKAKRDNTFEMRTIHALMLCCAAVLLIDIPGLLLDGRAFRGARALLWVFDTAYWVFHILYCCLWLIFAAEWTHPGARRHMFVCLLPLVCEMAIILSNPWTGWLFTLDEGNRYAPGAAYQLCLIPHYCYIAASLAVTVRGCLPDRAPGHRRRSLILLSYMFLPVCGVLMEFFAYGVSWVWPMVALSLLTLYLGMQQQTLAEEQIALARAAQTAAQMNAEMVSNRTAIMLSQIQPHFLYNALCVIQELCHGKAPEAEAATSAFSHFLRGNLDSLKADKPIPFSRELRHTRDYLALEQIRFEERLRVEYDLKAEDFCLPALTLQPIVENAVRYGVMKKERGGTVRISSARTDQAYTVTVRDDGVGFDPYQKHEDGRTHIGIENVRQRLRVMCGGDLLIKSVRGRGTVVTITLPKEGNGLEDSRG